MKLVPVLIAGGGPVGMTLACELSRRGIECMLVERNATTTRYPKMDITNARSMGFRYSSVNEWRRLIRENNDGSMPGEAPMRVSQVEIEPVLQRAVQALPGVEAQWGVSLEELTQDMEGVTVTLRASHATVEDVRCHYLVGCDGGTSQVRNCLGIRLDGQARVMDRFLVHFRSTAHHVLQHFGVAWHYQSPKGTLIAQNDRDIWTFQARFPRDIAPEKIDAGAMLRDFAGYDFDYEILLASAWTPHLLVAERYAVGRVFLAGDAAHQYIPTGGYGMNTGIADACDLGWKLAARLHGFAGPTLLSSYDAERRPVGLRNREASKRHSETRRDIASLYHCGLTALGPDGDMARADAGRRIAAFGNAENESYGIEYGYAYPESPVICAEPEADIPSDPLRYIPTTFPGVRMPSVVLGDHTPIYDRLGLWFTLVCAGTRPSGALVEAAARRGVPLDVVRLDEPDLIAVYGRRLMLVRPDQHIAWRGAACDDRLEAEAIIARALGFAN